MIKKSSESWKLSIATMVPPLTIQDRIHTNDNITPLTRMFNPPAIPQKPVNLNPTHSARQFRECIRTVQQVKDTIRTTFEDGLITPTLYVSMNYLLDELMGRFNPTVDYPIGLPISPQRPGFKAKHGTTRTG